MRREDIPEPSASTFKQAQEFIREYKISQWRTTHYLVAISVLVAQGTMPTDVSIARYLSDKRAPTAVANTIKGLIKAGLVKGTGDTAMGQAYRLTNKGEQAVVRIRQINAAWERLFEDRIDPEQPDYSKAFERLNRTIKTQQQTIDSQQETISYQRQVIAALQREMDAARGSRVAPEVTAPNPAREQMIDPFEQ